MSTKDNWLPMPRFLLRLNALKQMLKNQQVANKKCLEIGFGAGEILKYMAKKGAIVKGFEFSKKAMEIASIRTSLSKYADRISITADESTIKEGYYDLVFAFEVLEHIEKDNEAFNRWLSYVKPGGSLIISVPAHMSKWCKNDIWAGHIKRYEKKELMALCDERATTIKHLWNYGFPLTIILDKMLNNLRNESINKLTSSKEKLDLTKKSGIDRNNRLIYRLFSNDIALFPFYLLQRFFYKRDFGSSYILHVTKNE